MSVFASIAARTTVVAAGETDFAIESGESIIVYAITAQGTSAGLVVAEEYGGTTVKAEVRVAANGYENQHIAFRADNGLQVTTPVGVKAIVYHSSGGV